MGKLFDDGFFSSYHVIVKISTQENNIGFICFPVKNEIIFFNLQIYGICGIGKWITNEMKFNLRFAVQNCFFFLEISISFC